MKVLLKQDIESLGRMGEVVDVKRGYARNYLVPRGLAVGVTRGGLKDISEQQKVLEVKAARERERFQGVAEKMAGKRIALKARCSSTGKLFGSITSRQLASEIEAVTGQEVDRHKLSFDERVRTVGTHHALLKLHPDVHIDIEFEVEGEGFVAEEPPEEHAEETTAPPGQAAGEVGGDEVAPEALVGETGEPAPVDEVHETIQAEEPAENEIQSDSETE